MWIFTSVADKTEDKQVETLNWGQENHIALQALVDAPLHIVSDDMWSVAVIGRARPYGKSYDEGDANWLLPLLQSNPDVAKLYKQISGFFVLLIGNKSTGEMSVVNDHLGTLPLFWEKGAEFVRIATHLRLLKTASSKISNQGIYNYFYFHCIPAPLTLYQNVFKMLPGHCLSVEAGGLVNEKLVYLPDYAPSQDSPESLHQACRDVVGDAVKWNANEDCGAFLSGGLDSSTVAGMLATKTGESKTFSIGFKAKGYDETEYALITANHFNTEHKTHYLEPEEIIENFVDVAGFFEEPFGNSSAMAAFVCAGFAKRNGVNTLLAGDGGDELFAGNERYAKQKVFDLYWKMPAPLRSTANAILDKSPVGSLPLLKKGRSYVRQARIPMPDRLHTYNFLNRMNREEMFDPAFFASVDDQLPSKQIGHRYQDCPSDEMLEKMLFLDWKFTLTDNDLVKVTRMCDKAGVDVRFPLLEKEVVDFSCVVPSNAKLPGMKLRDFYKQTFTGFLSDDTINKPKHGFGLPFGFWMKENPKLSAMTMKYLTAFKSRNILNVDFIDKALEIYNSGSQGYYGELIWIMLVLEVWLQENED